MAACVAPAFADYTTIQDQTFGEGQIPTYEGSNFSHLLYDNNQSDGRVISNANIDVRNDGLWVGPGNTSNTHATAQRPTLVRLDGKISGAGKLKFNEYPSAAANFVIYELTNSSSTFTGTISMESGHETHADNQLNLNGVADAYAGALIEYSGTSPTIINLLSSASIKGLNSTTTNARITSSDVNNVLTLNNDAAHTYGGSLGAGTYHSYAIADDSTTFANATSTAISLKKLGSGTQTITGAANLHNVTVGAGTLNLNGVTTLGGAVTVTGGALNIANLLVTKEINITNVAEGATFNISSFEIGENHQLTKKEGAEDISVYTMNGATASANGYKAINGTYLLIQNYVMEIDGNSQLSNDGTNTYVDVATITDNTQFYVNEGTVAMTAAAYNKASDTATFTVASGATLDLNGTDFAGKRITLNEGATLTNTGRSFGDNARQIDKITLKGSAEVNIGEGHGHGLTAQGWNTSYLELGSNTLTKTGSGLFRLVNTTVDGTGTIDVQEGTLYIGATAGGANDRNVSASGVTFKTTAGSKIELVGGADLTAKALVGDGGKITGTANTVLTVESAEKHTYGGSVENALSLYKNGTGTMELSGANTYSGGTTINAGTVKASNDSALGTGAVSVKAGANLELGKDLQVSSLTIEEGGSLIFGNGTKLTVSGTLTLANANDIKLAEGFTFDSADEVKLATGTLALGEGFDATTWAGAGIYTIEGVKYTSALKAEGDAISVTFKQMVEAPGEPISVTGWDLKGTALTLNVNAALSEGMEVSVDLLDDATMQKILTELGENYTDGKPMVTITLQGTNAGGIITADKMNEVVFVKGDTGLNYWGEMVDGVGLMYNVERIPEPASATLSLAALMMLCARRRRQK